MTLIPAGVLAEFLSALVRCTPAGESTRSPSAVHVRATATELALSGTRGGVGLCHRAAGAFAPLACAVPPGELQEVARKASGAIEL